MDVPWREMPEAARQVVLRGKGGFEGVYGFFAQLERKKYKLHVRVMLSKYRGYAECPDCRGQRLRAEARAVRIDGKNICEAAALTIAQAKEFFDSIHLTPMQEEIAGPILEEVRKRLGFLDAVGLEYLTLDRLASDALRRRGAADSTGDFAGVAAGGRALRARRAVHRAAHAGHGAADPHS